MECGQVGDPSTIGETEIVQRFAVKKVRKTIQRIGTAIVKQKIPPHLHRLLAVKQIGRAKVAENTHL